MQAPDASIVIPSWNSRSTIRECLESVFNQQTDRSYEVIVVDSSSDGTAEIVSEFPEVKLIKLQTRTYSGAARNIGVSESSGRIIFFLDSDAIAEPHWVEKMMYWHERNPCAAVAGAILNGNPESLISWASYVTEFSEDFPVGVPHYQILAATANLSYKRWVFDKYRGFNEQLKQYVDTEFNYRIYAGGDKLLFVPSILVKHTHRTNLCEYFRHEMNRGRSALALRRRGYLPYSHLARLRWLCVLVSGPLFVRLTYSSITRFARTGMLSPLKLMAVVPVSIFGLIGWTSGFLAESIHPTIKLVNLNEQQKPVYAGKK